MIRLNLRHRTEKLMIVAQFETIVLETRLIKCQTHSAMVRIGIGSGVT